MKKYVVRVAAAFITFLLGMVAAGMFRYIQSLEGQVYVSTLEAPVVPPLQPFPAADSELRKLTPKESQIVREAEAFICQNGYTEQQCGTAGRIYFEPGENPDDAGRIWRRRRDTLEAKAYGLMSRRKGSSTIWTVVFRYTERTGKDRGRVGRAWVVEEGVINDFIGLRHDFPLARIEKKL